MKKSFSYIITLSLFTILYSCNIENDFIVDDDRAGLLKLGQKEKRVRELFADHLIDEFASNVSDSEKFFTINTSSKAYKHPIQVYFRNNRVRGIKVFSVDYQTSFGIRSGMYFLDIEASYHLWFPLNQPDRNGVWGEINDEKGTLKSLGLKSYGAAPHFTIKNKVYYLLTGLYSWDKIESLLVGENFNFKEDTKSADEKKQDLESFGGKISGNKYINAPLKLRFLIPEGWELKEDIVVFDVTADVLTLSSKNSNSKLNLSIQMVTDNAYLDKLRSKLVTWYDASYMDREDLSVYRVVDTIDNMVFYVIVINGITYMFHGPCASEGDQTILDELMMTVEIN